MEDWSLALNLPTGDVSSLDRVVGLAEVGTDATESPKFRSILLHTLPHAFDKNIHLLGRGFPSLYPKYWYEFRYRDMLGFQLHHFIYLARPSRCIRANGGVRVVCSMECSSYSVLLFPLTGN